MIKSDWNVFKAKYSENPQKNFEWFCYILFCRQYERPYGIFRYKDQAAIETDPIEKESEIIGWQAKYYETTLSQKKQDIEDTIKKAKKIYSKLSTLVFYTNQEWVQDNKGNDPKGKLDIEKTAKDLNIKVIWQCASFFESEFVVNKNKEISTHFFSFDKSIFDQIEEQINHNQNVLNQIHTHIDFNGNQIELNRDADLNELKNKKHRITIISGIGGVGKTVLVKKYYEDYYTDIPFYVFKATQFELSNLNDLFKYSSFSDFVNEHRNDKSKTILIDSAEKLLELKNSDPFKEFLQILIDNNWDLIFTTRDNYLEDLNFEFFEIYKIAPQNIKVNNLSIKELHALANQYSFSIPKDEKLVNLILNPFYLNEYLSNYNQDEILDYIQFKERLWKKKVVKSKPERELCFLSVALERAEKGCFYLNPNCDPEILNKELVSDGILGYESASYFITHDIYEEWALEKIINNCYLKSENVHDFFNSIGQSLSMRRCFRNWLSEKLLLNDEDIKKFIDNLLINSKIKSFWKDEALISVLLSNYSEHFFKIFKNELISNDLELLKKIVFLIRIACKKIDDDFLGKIGVHDNQIQSLIYVPTTPNGQGWCSLIKFIYDNLKQIDFLKINFIFPILEDWNNKNREGDTVKYSSLIALRYYQWIIDRDSYLKDDMKDQLLGIILNGSVEIKNELKEILDEILSNNWKSHRDPYYDLSEMILTKINGAEICRVLPKEILKLAELFWINTKNNKDEFYSYSTDVDQYYNLDTHNNDYHPASAYQTPIFFLLRNSLKDAVDFIISFTNKAVSYYSNSKFENTVEEVIVEIGTHKQRQYISNSLWSMYRGTGSPITPYLLQSIHMALEKYFLLLGKETDSENLENWLFYLLKNSKSASISAIVTSIVLAYPDKTLNVALCLFRVKEFILFDSARKFQDKEALSLYSIGTNWGNTSTKLFDNERIDTCEDKHRSSSLEELFLGYQVFTTKNVTEEEFNERQEKLWKILDKYYAELSDASNDADSDSDKIWRIALARIDRREMDIATKETDKGIAVEFRPKLEDDLKKFSEKNIMECTEKLKYTSLKLWAENKSRGNERYKEYITYEENPLRALEEVREICKKLEKINAPNYYQMQLSTDEEFFLFNYSIPSFVCSVLIEHYLEKLSEDDRLFCKDIIMSVAMGSLNPNYRYQISDGVQQSIAVLPILFDIFPLEKENIKYLLLYTLFNDSLVGGMVYTDSFNTFTSVAIHKLWKSRSKDAKSLLFGYLLLKPKYEKLRITIRTENYENGIQETDNRDFLQLFTRENEATIHKIVKNELVYNELENLEDIELEILKTGFQLIPYDIHDEELNKITISIINAFSLKIFLDNRDEKVSYRIRHDFFKLYAYLLLNSTLEQIDIYLKPIIENLKSSEYVADLFDELIYAEDNLNTKIKFWYIWDKFKDGIIKICEDGYRDWNVKKIIRSYLFADIKWKETTTGWHSISEENLPFFKEMSEKIGFHPFTLFSLSKFLNDIGSSYANNGIDWISIILTENENYQTKDLEINTIYYLEMFIKKFVFENKEKIKRTISLKNRIIPILNFLIEKSSVAGYMVRESIV